jgi:hypothetical protein
VEFTSISYVQMAWRSFHVLKTLSGGGGSSSFIPTLTLTPDPYRDNCFKPTVNGRPPPPPTRTPTVLFGGFPSSDLRFIDTRGGGRLLENKSRRAHFIKGNNKTSTYEKMTNHLLIFIIWILLYYNYTRTTDWNHLINNHQVIIHKREWLLSITPLKHPVGER